MPITPFQLELIKLELSGGPSFDYLLRLAQDAETCNLAFDHLIPPGTRAMFNLSEPHGTIGNWNTFVLKINLGWNAGILGSNPITDFISQHYYAVPMAPPPVPVGSPPGCP